VEYTQIDVIANGNDYLTRQNPKLNAVCREKELLKDVKSTKRKGKSPQAKVNKRRGPPERGENGILEKFNGMYEETLWENWVVRVQGEVRSGTSQIQKGIKGIEETGCLRTPIDQRVLRISVSCHLPTS